MHDHVSLILSCLGCGGASAFIGKWAISKALSDLSKLSEKVSHINENLAAIDVKLQTVTVIEEELLELTKKIAYLEARTRKK